LKQARERPLSFLYVSFIRRAVNTGRDFTGLDDRTSGSDLESPMDIVFVALGLGLFAAFGLYAVFLKQI
jgi:hypothetical protein